jgi:hypothetical protein
MRVVGSQIYGYDLKREGVFHILISTVDQGVDGSRQLRSATAAARRTERRRHGHYSGEAARGLQQAFFDEV